MQRGLVVVEALLLLFWRADVPDAVKHSLLRTDANAWCTSRRFQAEVENCVYGCGAAEADMLEHYLFCPELLATALRHLRLHLDAVRHGGSGRLLQLLGSPGERGMRHTACSPRGCRVGGLQPGAPRHCRHRCPGARGTPQRGCAPLRRGGSHVSVLRRRSGGRGAARMRNIGCRVVFTRAASRPVARFP